MRKKLILSSNTNKRERKMFLKYKDKILNLKNATSIEYSGQLIFIGFDRNNTEELRFLSSGNALEGFEHIQHRLAYKQPYLHIHEVSEERICCLCE